MIIKCMCKDILIGIGILFSIPIMIFVVKGWGFHVFFRCCYLEFCPS